MTPIILIIVCSYSALIGILILGFFKVPNFKIQNLNPIHSFSIIIPFRNEAKNLPQLLESICALNYPEDLYEVLLINDGSEDDYLNIINSYQTRHSSVNLKVFDNIRKSKSPKKDAIETGIQFAGFDWVLTTDADCTVPTPWLKAFDQYIESNKVVLIAGPVTFKESNSFLDRFQLIDFSAVIGCTVGGFGIQQPFLCNGANLCYSKSAFNAVNGYYGNNTIASGDDIFLLEKITLKYPNQIGYLKCFDAIIQTSTMKNLRNLFSQRIRWASKSSAYTNKFTQFVAIAILSMNLLFCFALIHQLINLSVQYPMKEVIFSKIILDLILIGLTLKFKKKLSHLNYYAIISIIHPFFNVLVGFMAIFKKNYHWKNRTFSK